MRNGVRAFIGFAAAATVFTTACSDMTAPPPPAATMVRADTSAAQAQLLGGLLGGVIGVVTNTLKALLVSPVKRNTPLYSDVVWTFNAGPAGGFSSRSSVGLTIIVPPGALAKNQTIKVTALRGSAIAYRFEPHLEFAGKVALTQDLRNTSGGGGLLGGLLGLNLTGIKGGHFEGDRLQYSGSQVRVTEIVGGLLSVLTKTATIGVDHFSGWIFASGYDNGY